MRGVRAYGRTGEGLGKNGRKGIPHYEITPEAVKPAKRGTSYKTIPHNGRFRVARGISGRVGRRTPVRPYARLEEVEYDMPDERKECPDGGRCHHGCAAGCFRVAFAEPLSAAHYPRDEWPAEVVAEYGRPEGWTM